MVCLSKPSMFLYAGVVESADTFKKFLKFKVNFK
jgi:hypothetical protein